MKYEYEQEHIPAWKDDYAVERYIAREEEIDESAYKGSFLIWLVSFIFPIAGFVIYLFSKEDKPGRARSAASGALVFIILAIIVLAIAAFGVFKGYIVIG